MSLHIMHIQKQSDMLKFFTKILGAEIFVTVNSKKLTTGFGLMPQWVEGWKIENLENLQYMYTYTFISL